MLSIIVAISDNYVIGKENKLLWSIPEDLKRFRELTTGKTMIMGRKTFESLGRVLPNRKHLVLTRSDSLKIKDEMVEIIHDISELQPYVESEEEVFVIGGGIIYNLLLPKVSKMYVTQIHQKFEGDTYFPKIDETIWKEISREKGICNEQNPYDYEYIEYVRK